MQISLITVCNPIKLSLKTLQTTTLSSFGRQVNVRLVVLSSAFACLPACMSGNVPNLICKLYGWLAGLRLLSADAV